MVSKEEPKRKYTKEEVEKLMLDCFPSCPLCGAKGVYRVEGFFSKSYVRCKSCGAKWFSHNFEDGEELRNLILWEPAYNFRGDSLAKKKQELPVEFWKDPEKVKKELGEENETATEIETNKSIASEEIEKYDQAIERLAVLFAEGKIDEESYGISVRTLEERKSKLKTKEETS
jgi:hypothetical protein